MLNEKKRWLIGISLILTVYLSAGKIIPLPELMKPKLISIEGDQIFIMEMVKTHIYSKKEFKHLKTFGKRGEGPGELKIDGNAEIGLGVQISVRPKYILANSIGRITYFDRDGIYLKEIKTFLDRVPYGRNFSPIGDGFVAYGYKFKNKTSYVTINLFNSKFKIIKELYEFPFFAQRGKKINVEIWRPSLFYVKQKKIFIDKENGNIDIFNDQGERINSIPFQYKKVRETKKRKNKYIQFLKTDPRFKSQYNSIKDKIFFPEYLPLIKTFFVDNKYIYVITNQKENNKNKLYMYDYKGNLINKKWIHIEENTPIEPYPLTINKGTVYQIIEDLEKELWKIHINKIEQKLFVGDIAK